MVELVVSMVVMALLLTALGSALVLASAALPEPDDPLTQVDDASLALDRFTEDLYGATDVTARSATSISITVPDRTGDGVADTIVWSWAGSSGSPLRRKLGTKAWATVLDDVASFQLAYDLRTVTTATTQDETVYGPEEVLASFDGWAGVSASSGEQPAGSQYYLSQYFEIAAPASPDVALEITKVSLKLRMDLLTSPQMSLSIYPALTDGSFLPGATAIGPSSTISTGLLSTLSLWVDTPMSENQIQDFTNLGYCLLVNGTGSDLGWVEYLNARRAPTDSTRLQWSYDAGGTWNPAAKDIDQNDARFYVYGRTVSTSSTTTDTSVYYLRAVDVELAASAQSLGALRTRVPVLNEPEVAAP